MRTRTEIAIYRALAVTAMAGVLATILWPVTTGHRTSPTTVCLTRMRQLSTGTLIYADDHDETFPLGRAATGPTAVGWAERIHPFVKSETIYADPLDEGATVSYALNANVAAIPKLGAIEFPMRSVLLYEIANARTGRGGDLHATLRLSPVGDGAAGGLLDSTDPNVEPEVFPATGALANSGLNEKLKPRHQGKSCFIRIDGGGRARLPAEVSAGANAWASRDPALPTGGVRPDLPRNDRPRAQGAGRNPETTTFSLR